MITQPQACFNESLNKNNSSCSPCVYTFINQKCKMSQFTSPAHKHLVFIFFLKEMLNKRSTLTQVSISHRMLQTCKKTKKEITLSVIQSQAMQLSSVSSSHWISVAFDQVANHIYVGPVQTPALCRQSCHFRQQFIPPDRRLDGICKTVSKWFLPEKASSEVKLLLQVLSIHSAVLLPQHQYHSVSK